MIHHSLRGLAAALVVGPALVFALPASAQQKAAPAAKPAASAQPAQAAPAREAINPKAVELVRAMSARLAGAKAFQVHAEIDYDFVLDSGRKVEFAAALDASVRQPNGLAIHYLSDVGGKSLWYDGKTATLLDLLHNVYATAPAPPTTSEFITAVEAKQNLSLPLSDFLAQDPAARLLADLKSAFFVGPGDVGGKDCIHLAFSNGKLDWEIWIEDGKDPLPCKFVITYRNAPSWPKYSAVFSEWKFPRSLPDDTFVPELPKGAHQVEFVSIRNTPEVKP